MKLCPSRVVLPLILGGLAAPARAASPVPVIEASGLRILLAYEHGSQAPDAFLRFDLGPGRAVALRGVKGSYCRGQVVDADHPYETVSEHIVVESFWATPVTTVTLDASGHAIVDAAFEKPGAVIVFFGARESAQ